MLPLYLVAAACTTLLINVLNFLAGGHLFEGLQARIPLLASRNPFGLLTLGESLGIFKYQSSAVLVNPSSLNAQRLVTSTIPTCSLSDMADSLSCSFLNMTATTSHSASNPSQQASFRFISNIWTSFSFETIFVLSMCLGLMVILILLIIAAPHMARNVPTVEVNMIAAVLEPMTDSMDLLGPQMRIY